MGCEHSRESTATQQVAAPVAVSNGVSGPSNPLHAPASAEASSAAAAAEEDEDDLRGVLPDAKSVTQLINNADARTMRAWMDAPVGEVDPEMSETQREFVESWLDAVGHRIILVKPNLGEDEVPFDVSHASADESGRMAVSRIDASSLGASFSPPHRRRGRNIDGAESPF